MERKHFFTAAVLILTFAISGCSEITPPEFNSPSDPLSASFSVPAPSNLQASFHSSTEVVLGWSTTWEYEKGYTVERSVNGGEFEKIATLPALTKEYVVSGLDTTKNYSYRVKRFTDVGASVYSRLVSLKPPVKGLLRMKAISYSTNSAAVFSHDRSLMATASNSKFNQIILKKAPEYFSIDKLIDHAGKPVKAMFFSTDDKLLACGTEDSSVYVYDVNSQTLSFTIKGIKGGITSIDFSPNGRFMAVASQDKDILIYETGSWTVAYTLSRHSGSVNSICFSNDGSLLAGGSSDGTITLWNTSDWTTIRTIATGESKVMSVAFRPDGQVIAAAAGMSYCQYETATGNKIRSFPAGGNAAVSVAFSNDGKNFAGTCGTGLSIFDSNGQPVPLDYGDALNSPYSFISVIAASGEGPFITLGYPVSFWVPCGWIISYR